jgi:mRNA deadenylase 3'-5' endonuclease subunit Ccr4
MERRVPQVSDYLALRPLITLPSTVMNLAPTEHSLTSFTLMTYNILAQNHIKRVSYPYCSKDTLRWFYRRERLAAELRAYDADVVCFQEMDRFHDYFQPLLFKLGYDVKYILRNGPQSDVNCVGWKREKFRCVTHDEVNFAGTTEGVGSVPNVAQLVALQSLQEERLKIIVATTHLYWREDCDHIRLAQMHALFTRVMAFRETLGMSYVPIIAGDFNSDRESMAVQSALSSEFYMDPEPFDRMLEKSQMTPGVLKRLLADFTINWPRFQDAYAEYPSVVPGSNGYALPYTTFCLYKGILDFVLYAQYERSKGESAGFRLIPTALRVMPSADILEEEVALPNKMFASDHLALMVEFTLFYGRK